MTSAQNSIRLFFALWPDETVRKSLAKINAKLADNYMGKPMCPDNLHITLAFIGNVAEDSLECLLPMAASLKFKPFTLNLDYLGYFPEPRVIWAGQKQIPDALMTLVTELYNGVQLCGLKLDRRLFIPHLTLMRNIKSFNQISIKPVYWPVTNFCLIKSINTPEGVEYSVLQRWK